MWALILDPEKMSRGMMVNQIASNDGTCNTQNQSLERYLTFKMDPTLKKKPSGTRPLAQSNKPKTLEGLQKALKNLSKTYIVAFSTLLDLSRKEGNSHNVLYAGQMND